MPNKPIAVFSNQNTNIFNLMSICARAMEKENYSLMKIRSFMDEVMNSTSYEKALDVMNKWCDIRWYIID